MRRGSLVVVALVVGGCAFAGCHSSSRGSSPAPPGPGAPQSRKITSEAPEPQRATAAVIASPEGRAFAFFPHRVGRTRCVIRGGGPAPGLRVGGFCATRVVHNSGGGGAEVVFIETWPWRAFHYAGTPRRRATHRWRFAVSPRGEVALRGQSGDFPPQHVR